MQKDREDKGSEFESFVFWVFLHDLAYALSFVAAGPFKAVPSLHLFWSATSAVRAFLVQFLWSHWIYLLD